MEHNNEILKKLAKAISDLRQHNFFRIHSSIWKILLISLMRGLASGLVSILTYIISQMEFIPVLGDWISQLIEEIEKFDKNSISN